MIRLQINDNDGNIIQQDNLELENGDILLCQVNKDLTHQIKAKLSEQLPKPTITLLYQFGLSQ